MWLGGCIPFLKCMADREKMVRVKYRWSISGELCMMQEYQANLKDEPNIQATHNDLDIF